MKLLGNRSRGLVFVISAPAGTGKTTLVKMLVDEFPCVVASISFTTRNPRPGEIDGVHYHFLSEQEFEQKIDEREFLEYAKLYGCYYGTSRKWVEARLMEGKHIILTIDTQGALQLKGSYGAVFIFLSPPSLETLRQRLTNRGSEVGEKIEERLQWARQEMQAVHHYDYNIMNDDLNTAYQVLRSILIAEEHRRRTLN